MLQAVLFDLDRTFWNGLIPLIFVGKRVGRRPAARSLKLTCWWRVLKRNVVIYYHRLERSNIELNRAYDASIEGWAYDLKDVSLMQIKLPNYLWCCRICTFMSKRGC